MRRESGEDEVRMAYLLEDLAFAVNGRVDDLAAGIVHLLSILDPPDLVNIGSGEEISILNLAQAIAQTVGLTGRIETDPSKPDGTPRKLCDISRIKSTGWSPTIELSDGLKSTYASFLEESQRQALRSR